MYSDPDLLPVIHIGKEMNILSALSEMSATDSVRSKYCEDP